MFTSTVEPKVEKVAFNAVTSVPNGTTASMLLPEIVAMTSSVRASLLFDKKLKTVMSLATEAVSFDKVVNS